MTHFLYHNSFLHKIRDLIIYQDFDVNLKGLPLSSYKNIMSKKIQTNC